MHVSNGVDICFRRLHVNLRKIFQRLRNRTTPTLIDWHIFFMLNSIAFTITLIKKLVLEKQVYCYSYKLCVVFFTCYVRRKTDCYLVPYLINKHTLPIYCYIFIRTFFKSLVLRRLHISCVLFTVRKWADQSFYLRKARGIYNATLGNGVKFY